MGSFIFEKIGFKNLASTRVIDQFPIGQSDGEYSTYAKVETSQKICQVDACWTNFLFKTLVSTSAYWKTK